VVFAIILGIFIDHVLRWWHKRLGRNDALNDVLPGTGPAPEEAAPAESEQDGAPAARLPERKAEGHDGGRLGRSLPVPVSADAEPGR
jgi:membrane-associated protein